MKRIGKSTLVGLIVLFVIAVPFVRAHMAGSGTARGMMGSGMMESDTMESDTSDHQGCLEMDSGMMGSGMMKDMMNSGMMKKCRMMMGAHEEQEKK